MSNRIDRTVAVLALIAYVSFAIVCRFGGDVALGVQLPMGVFISALDFGAAGAAMAYLIVDHHARSPRLAGRP